MCIGLALTEGKRLSSEFVLWLVAGMQSPAKPLVSCATSKPATSNHEKEKYLNYPFRGNLEYTARSHDCSSRNDLIREFSVQTRFYRNRTVSHLNDLSEDTNFL